MSRGMRKTQPRTRHPAVSLVYLVGCRSRRHTERSKRSAMIVSEFTEEGTSKTVEAMGTTIHYHEVGEGPPAIFLHSYGLGTTAWITWHKVLPAFAKHFRCIAMDLPNFAKTGPVMYDAPIHTFQAKT